MAIVENPPFNGAGVPAAVTVVLAERTASIDGIVAERAREFLPQSGASVLAVGGYGRRQLFPHSDVDLLLLFDSERSIAAHKEPVSAFLRSLWDSGMRVSHSVRTPAECAEVHGGNIELNVSLLDQRYLAGDRALYAALAEALPRFIRANREPLVRNLARLTRERHSKYANTFYHLEPNVKETPGGLRDFQVIRWFEQLHQTGSGNESAEPLLQAAFQYLARLRCYLHRQSGRDNNTLSFAAQDALAEEAGGRDAAHWMREYYRSARDIYRVAVRALEINETQSSGLFAQFRDWRSRVANADLSIHRDRAHFRAPQRIEVEPDLILRLFEFIARHGIRESFEAAGQLASQLEPRPQAKPSPLRAHFAQTQPLWQGLNRVLTLPYAPLAVRAMHETGVLAALFPELEPMECLVIRDFYHRYTVDEHTLVAMQNLCAAAGAYADLRSEVQELGPLMFALLFHDVGKGVDVSHHVDASLRVAEGAMARIEMPREEQETVRFLIGHHLELSAALQSRDIFDPVIIRDLASKIGTVERLKALTLLTYADISAVNPSAMTPWRADQLWQLYLMVYNELTRALENDRIEAADTGQAVQIAFLQGFPTRYLRTHDEAAIRDHIMLAEKSRKRGVAVEIARLDAAWRMTLVSTDRPGLFAAAAGTLAGFGMNILRAEAFSNRQDLVLDTFTFADPHRTLELNPTEVDRLRHTAEKVISGKMDVVELLRARPLPAPPSRKSRISPRVSLDSDASEHATLIEILAEDRPRLLYDLASAISSNGGNIEVVLIDTEAHKAIDVFYVTEGGAKLDPQAAERIKRALETALAAA